MKDNDISKLLPDWTLSYLISENGHEKIYQADKDSSSGTKHSIVRAIFIPCTDDKFDEFKKDKDDEQLRECTSAMLARYKSELNFIRSMSGKSGWLNLRECYDFSNADGTQALIVARYEYAQSVEDFIDVNGFTQGAVLKMGRDMCRAFTNAQKADMVCGTTVPSDIFVDESCRFKLGKVNIKSAESKKYSDIRSDEIAFVAPDSDGEVLDRSSSVYNIGMLMYYFLNDRKLPFESELSAEAAVEKRLSGAPLPNPKCDLERITPIVMKACSLKKEDRYKSPYAMKKDIEEAYVRLEKELEEKNIEESRRKKLSEKGDTEVSESKDISAVRERKKDDEDIENEKKNRKRGIITVAVIAMIVAAVFAVSGYVKYCKRDISRHKIHLASVYYKKTDRQDEFDFNYSYTGEAKEPKIVIDGLEDLVEGEDYIVRYENNVEVGEATLIVSGKGKYHGEKTRTFTINPEKPGEIEKIDVDDIGSDYVVLSWSDAERLNRYVIYRFDFEQNKWSGVEYRLDASQTQIRITGLKSETTYKFKIRGVMTSDDDSTLYGPETEIEFATIK